MKICMISDTHSYHRKVTVPDADVLIHSGDITFHGELSIMKDFSEWLKKLPHAHKVVIFGNHELGCDYGANRDQAIKMIEDAGATYLENSSAVIDGVNFYGSPVQPRFFNWAFNVDRGERIALLWSQIPDDTEVLVTHGPPDGILDMVPSGELVGCKDLYNRIINLEKLKLHCFGHIHHSYGSTKVNGVRFVNASICTEGYKPTNNPIIVDI